MFRDGLIESGAVLHACAHFADDTAQTCLFFRIRLFEQGGKTANERQTGIHHRGELARENDQIGARDFDFSPSDLAAGFLLDGQHHETAPHQRIDGVLFIDSLLDAGDHFSGSVAGLVGKGEHVAEKSTLGAIKLTEFGNYGAARKITPAPVARAPGCRRLGRQQGAIA